VQVTKLTPTHLGAIGTLLGRFPLETIALRGMATYANLHLTPWYGVLSDNELLGLVLVIPDLVAMPCAPTAPVRALLGEALRDKYALTMMVGPQTDTDGIWHHWSNGAEPARSIQQTVYQTTAIPPGTPHTGFRLAEARDLECVAHNAANGEAEELRKTTQDTPSPRFLRMIEDRIQHKRTWVIEENGQIVFQVYIGPVLKDSCQLCGTYVPPHHRGKGWSSLGIHGLLTQIVPPHSQVVLRVDDDNQPALRAYVRNGFKPVAPFRVIIP